MKAVLITGSSKGIGKATARLFHENGYFVLLHGRNAEDLKILHSELKNSHILIQDLSLRGGGNNLATDAKSFLQQNNLKLTTLINNAGIYKPQKTLEQNMSNWESQFQVNLFAAVELTESLASSLIENAPSSVINVSSTLGLKPSAGVGAYSASKAAMVNWTQTLALELGKKKVRANCVCPGIVDTPIHSFHALETTQKEKALSEMSSLQPLNRIGTAEEVAESLLFLASEKSAWTTGAVLSVDGGINIA